VIDALDHIAIAVADLDLAGAAYEALLGRPPEWREEAAGARHAWFQLGNMALDIVQPDGPGESGDRVRARLAAGGDGLWGLAFAVGDLARTRGILARRAVASSEPLNLLSTDTWRLAFLDPEATYGVPIALAERGGRAQPGARFAADEINALDHVVINTANVERAVALYGARLGLDFRLDRSNPAWGARLLFFRCGDAVVEVSAGLNAAPTDAPDRLSGLAWRAADPDAARARLADAGFDVSEARAGRKPGTRVFTVRAGVAGAPALVIGGGEEA
jgi:catechol 2,3-dioxygenase-like lactoylglutathione lyase family enzyme